MTEARRLLAVVLLLSAVTPAAAGSELLKVPIRWCSLEGTSATENPGCACESSTTKVLHRRMTRANANSYLPSCSMVWRSAASLQVPVFPVIPDPCDPEDPPGDNSMCVASPPPDPGDPDYATKCCPGVTGDIHYQANQANNKEHRLAVQACADAWDQEGVGTVGIVGVNIRRYVDKVGAVLNIGGKGSRPAFCQTHIGELATGGFTVVDNDFTISLDEPITAECLDSPPCIASFINDPDDQVMAHEAGHAMSLDHKNCTLMNTTAPHSPTLMSNGPANPPCPNPVPEPASQCEQVRFQAICHVSGAQAVNTPPGIIGDTIAVGPEEGASGHLGLAILGLVDDAERGLAAFSWEPADFFPPSITGLSYAFALDLDRTRSTGGSPASVGFEIPLQGVELLGVTTVDVTTERDGTKRIRTTARLFEFEDGEFVEREVLGSMGTEGTMFVDRVGSAPPVGPETIPAAPHVIVEFDRELLMAGRRVPEVIRAQAASFDPSGASRRSEVDNFYLVLPVLPECDVSPDAARPGDTVSVSASDLPPDAPVEVFVGENPAGSAVTDTAGNVTATATIPPDATPGTRPVLVAVDDPVSAITANCVVNVLGDRVGSP